MLGSTQASPSHSSSSTLISISISITLVICALTLLPSSSAGHAIDTSSPDHHYAPPISIPLHKVGGSTSNKRSPGWAEHIVNLKASLNLDDSIASSTLPLLEARVADINRFHWIQDRISSKWSQKDNTSPQAAAVSGNTDNEAIKRANKGHRPVDTNNNSKRSRFAKVKKRQDAAGGTTDPNAPFPPSADTPPQPTLATSRQAIDTLGQSPAKTPLYDDVVAREDIEVSKDSPHSRALQTRLQLHAFELGRLPAHML